VRNGPTTAANSSGASLWMLVADRNLDDRRGRHAGAGGAEAVLVDGGEDRVGHGGEGVVAGVR
jgi:hypothetical protein